MQARHAYFLVVDEGETCDYLFSTVSVYASGISRSSAMCSSPFGDNFLRAVTRHRDRLHGCKECIHIFSFQVQIYRHTYNSINEYMIYSQEAANAISGREQFHSVPALEDMDINATGPAQGLSMSRSPRDCPSTKNEKIGSKERIQHL